MKQIKRYTIVRELDTVELADAIEGLLVGGWELYGPPFYSHRDDEEPFHQAMIHQKAENE